MWREWKWEGCLLWNKDKVRVVVHTSRRTDTDVNSMANDLVVTVSRNVIFPAFHCKLWVLPGASPWWICPVWTHSLSSLILNQAFQTDIHATDHGAASQTQCLALFWLSCNNLTDICLIGERETALICGSLVATALFQLRLHFFGCRCS